MDLKPPGETTFRYEGLEFALTVTEMPTGAFMPRVRYLSGAAGAEPETLPEDTDAYASAAEAWRHAEQQAMRWAHDRTGEGQGRF